MFNFSMIFAGTYAFAYLYIQKEKQKAKTENDLLHAQNDLLKSQINPHLLFNVLNSLKSQAEISHPDLPENIQRVAEMMRYSISNTNEQHSLVDITDELLQMKNLIEIQKMRFTNCSVTINCKGNIEQGHFITPLSFVTALENAFKHGEANNKQHPITLTIDVNDPLKIYFSCINKIKKGSIEISHGIGIDNTRNRLNLHFAGGFILNTYTEGDFYHYELTIKRKPVTVISLN